MWAYADSQDSSTLGFFTVHDPRVQFLPEIGMEIPEAVEKASEGNEQFMGSESSETAADTFADVDVLIVAEDNSQKATLQDDPLLGKLPAVERDSVAWLPENAPEAAASNPSPLNIDTEYMDAYLQLLDEAAAKAAQD
jgi:iron complex transport system substrate-binding protein